MRKQECSLRDEKCQEGVSWRKRHQGCSHPVRVVHKLGSPVRGPESTALNGSKAVPRGVHSLPFPSQPSEEPRAVPRPRKGPRKRPGVHWGSARDSAPSSGPAPGHSVYPALRTTHASFCLFCFSSPGECGCFPKSQ